MNLRQVIDYLKSDAYFSRNIKHSYLRPPRDAVFCDFPPDLHPDIRKALEERGITKLYYHQCLAYDFVRMKKNVLLATSTSSGKTLGYLLPVLQQKYLNPALRAMFLYPTKALSRDQELWFRTLVRHLNPDIGIFTYDGDTPDTERKKIRVSGDFIITNPDMLHANILPSHTQWIQLFENLEFLVLDECHSYRGVFGSHFANVLRRLFRLANFYGKKPVIIAASATLGNPEEFIERLTGQEFEVITEDFSAKGKKLYVFYNPPKKEYAVIKSEESNSSIYSVPHIQETVNLAEVFIKNKIPTIIFARSRKQVEILTAYLKERCPAEKEKIRAYRSGYLPEERREVERKLKKGEILCVVSTNALELGIDIGSLHVSISVGYPGTVHSFLQQSGRAGRNGELSLSILIATENSLDQFFIKHPEYLLETPPEHARLNPDNLWIVAEHLKCSVAEKVFHQDESFGNYRHTKELLEYLANQQLLVKRENRYYWNANLHPALEFSIRSGPRKNFVVIDITEENKVIGEVDYYSAPLLIHPEAIYIHQTETYFVEELLWEEQIAKVRKIDTDYYTEAEEKVFIKPLSREKVKEIPELVIYKGEIAITFTPTIYKKIKFRTNENVGYGKIDLPEIEMHTQSVWLIFHEEFFENGETGLLLEAMCHALQLTSTIVAMCEKNDVLFVPEVRDTYHGRPCIYFYDNFPGGLEISYFLYSNFRIVLEETISNIKRCDCDEGCPACIGVIPRKSKKEKNYKPLVARYLEKLLSLFENP